MNPVILLIGIIFACCSAQVFQIGAPTNVQISGDNDQCAAFCDQTYGRSLETSELAKSCKQGCRLFSMLQLSTDRESPANETTIRETCTTDCFESYTDLNFRKSCADGCLHQIPYTSGALQVQMDDSSPLFRKAMESMMGQMSSLQKHFYEQFESAKNWFNNGFPTFEQLDQNMNARMQNFFEQVEKSLDNNNNDDDGDTVNPLSNFADKIFGRKQITDLPKSDDQNGKHKPLQTLSDPFQGPTVGNQDENNDPIIIVHIVPQQSNQNNNNDDDGRQEPAVPSDDDHSDEDSTMLKESANEPSPPIDRQLSGDPDDDWLSCLARRARRLSLITRWMLCIALMLSVASMIWICLAIMRTAPRRRLLLAANSPDKKSIYEVVYTTPPATASDKSPMIISTKEKEPLTDEPESPPPPYEVAPVHGIDKTPQA